MERETPQHASISNGGHYRSVEEIVKALIKQVDVKSLPVLLSEAAAAGAQIGGREAVRRLAQQISDRADEFVSVNAATPRAPRQKASVKCPVLNCTRPGVRPLRCFCPHHFAALDTKKREDLRAKQIDARKRERDKAVEAERAA